jgi:seryl-tRNA synthetase
MLNERYIRAHPDAVRAALRQRAAGTPSEAERMLDEWLALDAHRRDLAASLGARTTAAERARDVESDELARTEAQARATLLRLPNLPRPEVPEAPVEIRRWGEPRAFAFTPRRHDEIAATLGILDLPRATKLSGSRFPLLIGQGARLVRALAALMLDLHTAHGYTEIAPPHLLKAAMLEGSGHLPRHEEEVYAIARDGLYLSPTAEAQLVALHAGETLPIARLPLAYVAWTPCYRREAGSASAATRGLIRQHQFEKVELVHIATAEGAEAAFAAIVADAEKVLRALELPYRVVTLAARDLPFASCRTVDLEVWMPGQGRYVEISSVSDCGDFQARRLGLRYKPGGGGHARYAHTLNGSALAIGRTLAALVENGQRMDGSVALPEALARYLPEHELIAEPRR